MSEDDEKVYGRKMKVDVEVSSKELKDSLKRQNELESELEDTKGKLKLAAKKIFEQKKRELNAPDSIKTVAELKQWQEENENDTNYYEPPVGRGSSGSLKLRYAQGSSSKREFSSYEDLIDYLRETGDKETLNKLWQKQLNALKSGDLPSTIYDGNKLPEDKLKTEPSLIMKVIQRKNEQIRRKMQRERES